MIQVKIISSLDKVMPTDTFDTFEPVEQFLAAKGERISFQLLIDQLISENEQRDLSVQIDLRSKLSQYVQAYDVGYVPCAMPVYQEHSSGEFISTTPGLFPDILYPIEKNDMIRLNPYGLKALWFTVTIPQDLKPGTYTLSISLGQRDQTYLTDITCAIEVKDVVLPKSGLKYTQWFHCDCIADYHGVKMMSEKHWNLIEKYIETAAYTGINMILTPIFTPPLDTAVGTYRKTMQLVRITKTDDTYTFDFHLLDRWVHMCQKYGIAYFEISHLFTQWGVCACPKIIVQVNGREERLFGWDIPSDDPRYLDFLSQFLPALTEHLRILDIADNCYFHISDEPNADPDRPDYQNYLKAKNFVKQYLGDYKIMDALSHAEFFDNGLIEYPVIATNHMDEFAGRTLKERWCYYCCGQDQLVANRFIAMPSYRNRASGIQFYMNDMEGFLHWGYNFYYASRAEYMIDPYRVTDGGYAFPSGDPFTVYPGKNGAILSLRAVVFYEGLQDRLLLKSLEKKIGTDGVKALVEKIAGSEVSFENCLSSEVITEIHDTALRKIAEN